MVLFIIIYKTAGYNRFNNTLKIAGRLAFVTIDNKKIGKRIREARVKRHLTQEELAEGAGVTVSYVANAESGNSCPSLDKLFEIADALSIWIGELLCDNVRESDWVFRKEIMETIKDCREGEKTALLYHLKFFKRILREDEELKETIRQWDRKKGKQPNE